jgi:hypothetical protein
MQYFLWYGILGTLVGRKLQRLTKLARRLPTFIGQFLFGIPGSKLVLAGDNLPFAHSEEFIAVRKPSVITVESWQRLCCSSDGGQSALYLLSRGHRGAQGVCEGTVIIWEFTFSKRASLTAQLLLAFWAAT